MIEPTETETQGDARRVRRRDAARSRRRRSTTRRSCASAPHDTRLARLDETRAARRPVLRWRPPRRERLQSRLNFVDFGRGPVCTVPRRRDVGPEHQGPRPQSLVPAGPHHVVRRALSLLYQDIARAVDDEYRTFDFASWADLRRRRGLDRPGRTRAIRVPRVILLQSYDRVPRRYVRFSRFNIYARDQNRCQYCGRQFPRSELNLDHVVPRSQGGTSVWENVVCSCHRCNRVKGGRTPAEAGMRLIRAAAPAAVDAVHGRGLQPAPATRSGCRS